MIDLTKLRSVRICDRHKPVTMDPTFAVEILNFCDGCLGKVVQAVLKDVADTIENHPLAWTSPMDIVDKIRTLGEEDVTRAMYGCDDGHPKGFRYVQAQFSGGGGQPWTGKLLCPGCRADTGIPVEVQTRREGPAEIIDAVIPPGGE